MLLLVVVAVGVTVARRCSASLYSTFAVSSDQQVATRRKRSFDYLGEKYVLLVK